MRILITGATGLVGNNCLRVLAEAGHELSALVRPSHDARPFADLEVRLHYADFQKLGQVRAAIADVDAIIHAAGDTHIGRLARPAQRAINVDATRMIAQAALEQSRKLVFVSSVDALPALGPDTLVTEDTEGDAKYPCQYVHTKRDAEAAVVELADRGLEAVIVNPGFMLGPWDWKPSSGRMLLQVATRFTPFGPKGGFSVCHVHDVARAIAKVTTMETVHQRYILAGTNMRYVEAWRIFAKVAGVRGPICHAGPLARMLAGKWGDAVARITNREGDVNSAAIGMSDLYHYYDSSRAIRELDYRIRPATKAAEDAWSWFVSFGYVPKAVK